MSKNANHQEPLLTGAKQTMLSWSKVIEAYDEIPDVYKASLGPELSASQEFPYIVLVPPLDKFLRRTSQKLVCDSQDAIHILENRGGKVIKISYPYQSVEMVESGIILLNSWMTLWGTTSKGQADSSKIDFNTATGERYFSVFLKKIRPAPESDANNEIKAEQEKFDYLSNLDFKFMNYARSSLIPGEKVIQSIFQPQIRKPAWKIFGWTFYKTISLAHLTILTDKELILIRDDERSKEVKGVRHGGVWQFIRRDSIETASMEEKPDGDLFTLVIWLSSGKTLEKIFLAAQKADVEKFCASLQP